MTPSKRKRRNDENAGIPQTPVPRSRDPFRTPLQPRHLANPTITPSPFAQPTLSFTPTNFTFLDGSTPTPNLKKRRVAREVSEQDVLALRAAYQTKEKERMAAEKVEAAKRETERSNAQVSEALLALRKAGFSIHQFLLAFLDSRDPSHSSQASQLLINHGHSILDAARRRQPKIMHDWTISTCRELVGPESEALAAHFRPRHGSTIRELVSTFSVHAFLAEAEIVAPTICQTLRQIGLSQALSEISARLTSPSSYCLSFD